MKQAPGRAHRLLFLFPLLAALAGCVTIPPERQSGPAPDAEARQLSAAGRHREAADSWLRLAAQARGKDTALGYRLSAADALLCAGDAATARRMHSEAQKQDLPAVLRLRSDIITARLALAERRAEQALATLGGTYPEQTPRADRWTAQTVRADARVQLGQPVEAARERVRAERYAASDSDLARNHLVIWDLLGQAGPRALEENRPPPPDGFGGWMELAALQRRHGRDPEALARALVGWRAQYPGHPAELDLVPEVLETARARGGMPAHIALLLPESGPFVAPGRAVREGFVAGWFGSSTGGGGSRVSLYEATRESVRTVLDQAVERGADFVVGPLDKGSLQQLTDGPAALPVPILALNRTDTNTAVPGEFYQFALNPEDEAREIARRTLIEVGGRPAVLHAESDWGTRLATAFREAWIAAGGQPPVEVRYGAQPEGIAQAVRDALQPGARPGSSASLVFLVGSPAQARQVRPQISAQGGASLPVYATSHVYGGVPNPQQDQVLDGVVFTDMPWVLHPEAVDPALQQAFEQNWKELRDGYNRLIAFGIDAYRVVRELGRLRASPTAAYEGVTGRLRLDAGNRIVRDLSWAQFQGGVPVPLTARATAP